MIIEIGNRHGKKQKSRDNGNNIIKFTVFPIAAVYATTIIDGKIKNNYRKNHKY